MKKLLSFILVLAMLLSMTAMPVFAEAETPAEPTISISGKEYVVANDTLELTATVTNEPTGATYAWTSSASTVASVTGATKTGTVSGVAAGTAVITCTMSYGTSQTKTATKTVKVFADGTFTLTDTAENLYQIIAKDQEITLAPTLYFGTSEASSDLKNAAVISYTVSPSSGVVSNTSGKIKGLAKGTATVTVKATIGDTEVARCVYTIVVSELELAYEVVNGSSLTISDDEFFDAIEDAIYAANSGSVDISTASIKRLSGSDYGTLKNGGTEVVGTTQSIASAGLTFEAKRGAIGQVKYEFTSGLYTGTVVFDVLPYSEIDEEVDAKFTHAPFYLDVPGELYYMKEVSSASNYYGVYTSAGMKKYDNYLFDVSSHTVTNGKITLYVVGIDDDGYAYSGKVVVDNANYDMKYIGQEDVKTSFSEKDFANLYEEIFEETNTSSTAYVEFEDATFTYSSNKNYKLYNDGSEMTTSKLKKVDADDIDDVEVEPLKSGEFYITVSLGGKYYSSSKATGSSKSYTAVILVSAVSGDVKYSVLSKSSVMLDEDDFQDFVEDELTSKALLNYITIDDSDLNASTEGSIKVLDGSKYVAIDDTDKFYCTGTKTQYEISDVRFTAASTAKNGAKVYIPFTAYGSKTGAEGGKTELASGYIEITVINNPFTDLTESWYKDAVLWAYGHNPQITKGTNVAGTLFSPKLGCTRAQAVTFLYRAAGAPSVTSAARTEVLTTFKDLDATKHKDYIDAIAWAKANGITSGTSATTFGPDKTCTRAQIVTFIYNYAKAYGKDTTVQYTNAFTDVKPTTTHKSYANAIQWAYEHKITSGTSATTFAPDATCTRGHIVTFLYNYFN